MDDLAHDLFTCPLCGGPATKAMYMGLPMKLCGDTDSCAYVWGGASWLMEWLPFNGWMIRYRHYGSALWEFLTGRSAEKAREHE